jgi:hypothetical protein
MYVCISIYVCMYVNVHIDIYIYIYHIIVFVPFSILCPLYIRMSPLRYSATSMDLFPPYTVENAQWNNVMLMNINIYTDR